MRLIDADALKKDDELTEWITRDTIRTGKMLKAFSELFVKKIDDAPTVNAVSEEVYIMEYSLRKDAEFKVYKLEKALKQEPCGDDISRHDVECIVEELENICHNAPQEVLELLAKLKNAPFATPYPKTGHWIEKDGFDGDVYYDCSECGESWTTIEGTPWQNGMNYCPNCGAKMKSEG